MPFYPRRRRYTRRPRRLLRRKTSYRSVRRTRVRRTTRGSKIHNFKRTFIDAPFNIGPGAPTAEGRDFRLNQLPNYSEFTELFDQYRICGVKITLKPGNDNSGLRQSSQLPVNTFSFWSVIDRNDITAPTSVNEMLEYQNVKRHNLIRGMKHYFCPNILTDTGATIYATNTPKYKQWIDTTLDDVPHLGLKLWSDAMGDLAAGQTFSMEAYVTLYIQCKNVK